MTETVAIWCPFGDSASDQKLLAELGKICPEGPRQQVVFSVDVINGDRRLIEIFRVLERNGWQPERVIGAPFPSVGSKTFKLWVDRRYDESDWDACDLLVLGPSAGGYCGLGRDPETGQAILDVTRLKKGTHFAMASTELYVISDKVIQLLDSSGLDGIVFQPTLLMHGRSERRNPKAKPPQWEDYGMFPWYELTAEVEFPPVVKRKGLSAEPLYRVDPKRGRIEFGGERFGNYEHHYRASDLAKLPKFDLARAAEHSDVPSLEHDRLLIASKRFYQFCRKHKLKSFWWPVRIDPD
jgi:hypothetical protein